MTMAEFLAAGEGRKAIYILKPTICFKSGKLSFEISAEGISIFASAVLMTGRHGSSS